MGRTEMPLFDSAATTDRRANGAGQCKRDAGSGSGFPNSPNEREVALVPPHPYHEPSAKQGGGHSARS